MTTKTIPNKDQIEVLIARITTNGKKLDGDIQAAAVGCIAHIEQCGDVRLFNRLFLAMPRGARKSALTAWGLAFGKIEANTGDNKKEQPFVYAKEKSTNLVDAQANPWYDFAPDKAPDEVCDVRALLAALVRKMDKAPGVKDEELAKRVRDFAAAELTD